MQGRYVHLRSGVVIANARQAELIREPLADLEQLRLESFEYVHDALELINRRHPHVVIADYERFGAAGIHGLAEVMHLADCPVILIVRDVSDWEREQFHTLGVHSIFEGKFKLADLAASVDRALKRRRRIGSSDRLPVVSV